MTHRKFLMIGFAAVIVSTLLWPSEVHAQRRVVRAPARTSVVVGVGVGPRYYRPYYYRPYFHAGFYDPRLPYAYPYGWYGPYAYGQGPYGYYADSASVRVQVEPKETEVFIDGYWAGTVDDFDGFFQRLHLEPGEHDVQLYLQGHRTVNQKIYLQPNGTFRIRHTMTPLGAGEAPDPRPVPRTPPPGQRKTPGPYDTFGRPERGVGSHQEQPERPEPGERSDAFGTLAIRVQPFDAEILIDGESWDAPESAQRLVVELPPGEHRVEIRKPGFATYTTSVRVRGGETTPLNVSLARE